MQALAENPRAVIGHNQADDFDFISARMIERGARIIQWVWPQLDDVLAKRKGGITLGARHVLFYCLRDVVPQAVLADFAGLNRKTAGEGAQRPAAWAEEDEWFAEHLERVRQLVVGYAHLDEQAFAERLVELVDTDPYRRRLEQQRKDHEMAAQEAERAAAELEERKRIRGLASLKRSLKGNPRADAIMAEQYGARHIAKTLSREALGVLATIHAKEAKHLRQPTSAYCEMGLRECLRLGIARNAEPHLSKSTDPIIGPTQFGARVYAEALGLELVVKPKRNAAS